MLRAGTPSTAIFAMSWESPASGRPSGRKMLNLVPNAEEFLVLSVQNC